MKGISSKYWYVYFPELSVFQFTVRVDKWLDKWVAHVPYHGDCGTLETVEPITHDMVRKWVKKLILAGKLPTEWKK